MNRIMNKVMLLVLLTSIGIVSAIAETQSITIDVVPDNAGSVQMWRVIDYGTNNVHYDFIGSTKTTMTNPFEKNGICTPEQYTNNNGPCDLISIIPFNDLLSPYKLVNMCDGYDNQCIKGTYIGGIWDQLPSWTVTAYYEIPEDKEPPKITGIVLSTTTPYVGDYINVMVAATDNVEVTKVLAEGVQLTYSGNSWNGKIQALYAGSHSINVLAYDGVGNYVQDTSKSYTSKAKPTPTPTPSTTPTPTPTPEIPFHVTKLTLKEIDKNWITVNISTTGVGTLGIDLDEARVLTKNILSTDKGFTTKFETTLGTHFVCVYDLNNAQNEIICDSIDIKPPPTPTPTPTYPDTTPTEIPSSFDTGSSEPAKSGLNAIYGLLNVDSSPNNATIYINKANMGLTPKRFDIKPGGHEVRIVKAGYAEFTKKYIVGEGQVVDVIVKLVKLNGTNVTDQTTVVQTTDNIASVSLSETNKTTNLNKENKQQDTPFNYPALALILMAGGLIILSLNAYSKSLKENKTMFPDNKSKDDLTEKIKKLFKK